MKDRSLKERHVAHGKKTLTHAQVVEIKHRYIKGNRWHPGNSDLLAVEFNVEIWVIQAIVAGRSYVHYNVEAGPVFTPAAGTA